MLCCYSEFGGVRDSVPDSPIADALLALKHAVVQTPHSGSNWMSPGVGGQLSYESSHCPSPTAASSSYQSAAYSASSPIYDRTASTGSPIQPSFPFASAHHHHQHHQPQYQQHQQQQHHRYQSTDSSQDCSSPALSGGSTSLYSAGTVHRPVYRRDVRDFAFGSSFVHDALGSPFCSFADALLAQFRMFPLLGLYVFCKPVMFAIIVAALIYAIKSS